MYTSDTKKSIFVTFTFVILSILINYIYGFFGHGVASIYMKYLFLIPLFGSLIYIILYIFRKRKLNRIGFNIFNSGLAILGVGSLIKGILEIAGTSSVFEYAYLVLGLSLVIIGLIILLFKKQYL